MTISCLFFVLISIRRSSSLSTNQDGPNSEQRIALEQVSLLAEDGQIYTEAEGRASFMQLSHSILRSRALVQYITVAIGMC